MVLIPRSGIFSGFILIISVNWRYCIIAHCRAGTDDPTRCLSRIIRSDETQAALSDCEKSLGLCEKSRTALIAFSGIRDARDRRLRDYLRRDRAASARASVIYENYRYLSRGGCAYARDKCTP